MYVWNQDNIKLNFLFDKPSEKLCFISGNETKNHYLPQGTVDSVFFL